MNVGTRVVVIWRQSSFHGQVGTVVAAKPAVMVRLDGDERPLRLEPWTLVPVSEPRHVAGAEW
jgi:hypothetical protein